MGSSNYPSPKMAEAFRLKAKGLRQFEIAKELGVVPGTVLSRFRRYTEDDAIIDQVAIERAANGNRPDFEKLRILELDLFWNVVASKAANSQLEWVENDGPAGGAWQSAYLSRVADSLGLNLAMLKSRVGKRQRKAA